MWRALTALAVLALASANAMAEETVKVGLILPMTGPFTTTGKQVEAGARFYMQQNGATVDGRKIELILRDDAGAAANSRRIAQELLVRQGEYSRRFWPHPDRARRCSACNRDQDAHGGHGGGHRDRDRALALYRALELSPGCAGRDHGRLGGQTWPEESGHGRFRLRTRPRFRNVFQTNVYPRGR